MAQTIYTVLGFVDEYRGRTIAKGTNCVEHFYKSEKSAADIYENYLYRLADERNITTDLKRSEDDNGHIFFQSRELTALVDSYYIENDLIITEPKIIPQYEDEEGFIQYAIGRISEKVFPTENPNAKLAFLIGAYARYGKDSRFVFANAYHKARLVEDLLIELGSRWIRCTRNMACIPCRHEIEFEMTEDMKRHFVLS